MKKYIVKINMQHIIKDIEAESPEEAKDQAYKEFFEVWSNEGILGVEDFNGSSIPDEVIEVDDDGNEIKESE